MVFRWRRNHAETIYLDLRIKRDALREGKGIIFENILTPADMNESMYYDFVKTSIKNHHMVSLCILLEARLDQNPTCLAQILWTVIRNKDIEIASMLVKAGADVNQPDIVNSIRSTFLQEIACRRANVRLVPLLMEYGADVTALDALGHCALQYAMRAHNLDIIPVLLDYGAVLDQRKFDFLANNTNENSEELAIFLVSGDHVETLNCRRQLVTMAVKALLTVNIYDPFKLSLLSAMLNLRIPQETVILKYLVHATGDVVTWFYNHPRIHTCTKMMFLHCSIGRIGSRDKVQMLIELGANVNLPVEMGINQLKIGMRPLHIACLLLSYRDIQALIEAGADVNALDADGRTPFSYVPHNFVCWEFMIRHFVFMILNGYAVNNTDILRIHSEPLLYEIYSDCRCDLQNMMRDMYCNGTSMFSALAMNHKELALLLSSLENFQRFYTNLQRYSIYRGYFHRKIKEVRKWNEIMLPRMETLFSILHRVVSDTPMKMIIYYVYCSEC
ncbi:serine/threonine-protein phosphatase 6 regulatory ankyrin repeat subunit A-like [Phymastichus coffea]|uniref:serine/threonine-protein phosphatase 6 regulatory ankyrin repeat subunit A-like n=1 Tax=Phymastichus coffea TaxID=108790 RepID=UPI00273B3209|nr:serine/threonine-protein phosphatase 6 regulatory ankyrin repeat subunit A-like [Phymastichus coffea]